jgi:two-component system phosphate regulon sensor histidine kinase PhoR
VCFGLVLISLALGHFLFSYLSSSGVAVAVLVFALLFGFLLSSLAMRLMASGIARLTASTERMAKGDFSKLSSEAEQVEFGELYRALDQLSRGLSKTLHELRAEGDRMRGILAGMHEGVLLLDGDGRIELVNPSLREMLLLGHDAVGKTPLELVRHAELKELLDGVRESGDEGSLEIELGGLKPRRLLVRAGRLSPEAPPVLAVFVDVTDMRRLESMRRDFVANVSHELRTPVTAVRSAAETLQNGIPSDPEMLKKFIGIIERNAERLHSLVEDLLDLSRIESREYRVTMEPVDLRALVGQVLGLFRDRAEKKHMDLRNDVGGTVATADRRALEHVVTNLIDNAVKYCGPGSQLVITADQVGDGVRLEFQDNGPGIEEKHLPRLFERFYRVDPGRSRELGGTGLGLSIVKHLVEAMAGRVAVESTPGSGTRFSVTLRRAPNEYDHTSNGHSRAVA